MKHVLLYGAATDLDRARSLFPEHRAAWKEFVERGELLMIGPFADPRHGAIAIFTTWEAAERFVALDPFVRDRVVASWELREWREAIVPEGK